MVEGTGWSSAINLTKDELYFYEVTSEFKGVPCSNVVLNSFVEKTSFTSDELGLD